jgi:hypothetical protein
MRLQKEWPTQERLSSRGGQLGRCRAADSVKRCADARCRPTPRNIALLSGTDPWPCAIVCDRVGRVAVATSICKPRSRVLKNTVKSLLSRSPHTTVLCTAWRSDARHHARHGRSSRPMLTRARSHSPPYPCSHGACWPRSARSRDAGSLWITSLSSSVGWKTR